MVPPTANRFHRELRSIMIDPDIHPRWMKALVRYTMSLCQIGQQAIINAFSKILDEKEAEKMAMSTMQELLSEGKIQGKKEMILDLLEDRFGKVPETIRVTLNSYSDLTALRSLAVLAGSCKSLDEFKDGLR